MLLGGGEGHGARGSQVDLVVGVTTQDDRVDHDYLQCHIRARNRERHFVVVVGVFPEKQGSSHKI